MSIQVPIGATSISQTVEIFDDSGLPVTGLLAATFPTVLWRKSRGSSNELDLPLSDLPSATTAWSDGGVFPIGQGRYRIDLSNSLFTTADTVTVWAEASGKHMMPLVFEVEDPACATSDEVAAIPAEVAALISPLTFTKPPTSFTPPSFDVTLKHGTDYVSATGRLTSFTIGGIPTPTAVRWDFKQGRTVKYSFTADFSASGSGWLISCPLTRDQLDTVANGNYSHSFMSTHSGDTEQEIASGHVVVV